MIRVFAKPCFTLIQSLKLLRIDFLAKRIQILETDRNFKLFEVLNRIQTDKKLPNDKSFLLK